MVPRVGAIVGGHVRLKKKAIPILGQLYGTLDADTAYLVERIAGGYDNDRAALFLRAPDGNVVLAWRGQAIPFPRCEYCGAEGHSNSSGTGKTCKVRAEEVAGARQAASVRMKERWAKKKGEAAPPPVDTDNEAPF